MNIEGKRRLDLLQIIGFGLLIIFPVHRLFNCSYLGKVESQVNTMSHEMAKKYLIYDYTNLNPIEDFENHNSFIYEPSNIFTNEAAARKTFEFSEVKRNLIQNDNLIINAL